MAVFREYQLWVSSVREAFNLTSIAHKLLDADSGIRALHTLDMLLSITGS